MSKNNVPYYIAGTLAIFTLLASGVFAAAPYIGFLAPVAALSVGLPFIIGGAIFSAVAMALSYKAISKNKTISEKDTQLADEKSKVEDKDKTISEKEAQLADEKSKVEGKDSEISKLRDQFDEEKAKAQTQKQTISEKDLLLADEKSKVEAKDKIISEKDALLIERDKKIEEDALKVAVVDNAVYAARNSYRLVKETVNGVLYSGKCAYDNYMPSTKSVNGLLEHAKDIKTASGKAFTSTKKAFISGRVTRIVKDGLKDVKDRLCVVLFSKQEQADKKVDLKSVKGKFTSFWSGVQSIYSKNVYNSCALGTDLLHAQHTSTLANVPQEEVINKEAQKPEEQADQKPNLQRDNSINNTEEGGKNKRSGAARRKRKQAQVEQPIVYAVRTSNKYDLLSPEYSLG